MKVFHVSSIREFAHFYLAAFIKITKDFHFKNEINTGIYKRLMLDLYPRSMTGFVHGQIHQLAPGRGLGECILKTKRKVQIDG